MVDPLPPAADLEHAHALLADDWERLRGSRVFLTGGTGFIGKWLLATLLDADRRLDLRSRVTVLSRNPESFRRHAPHLAQARGVEVVRGDVRDCVFPGGSYSHVIHAATDVAATASPLDTFDTCVEGTRRVLDFAIGASVSDFLYVSSGAVYGRQPADMAAVAEDFSGGPDTTRLSSAYGEGKRAAEWLAMAYGKLHSMRVKVARCFALIGPYMPLDGHFAAGNFLRDAIDQQPITIRGDGTPQRSYLHASDMAAWLWAILLKAPTGGVYNVGGVEAVSISVLANRIVELLASSSHVEVLTPPTSGAADRYVPDVGKIRRELSLGEPLTLDDAIRRTAAWYRHAVCAP